jgi:hypothetical protein
MDLQRDAEAMISEALALPQARSQWAAAIQPGKVALVRALPGTGGTSLDSSTLGPSTRLAVILGTLEQLDSFASEELELKKGKVWDRPRDGVSRDVVYVLALHEPSALDEADAREKVAHEPGFEGLRAVNRMWTPPPLPMCVSHHNLMQLCFSSAVAVGLWKPRRGVRAVALHQLSTLDEVDAQETVAHGRGFEGLRTAYGVWTPRCCQCECIWSLQCAFGHSNVLSVTPSQRYGLGTWGIGG